MSLPLLLPRTRKGTFTFLKKIICGNFLPSLNNRRYYQTTSSLIPYLLNTTSSNGKETTTLASGNWFSCSSTFAAYYGVRHYNSMKTGEQILSGQEEHNVDDDDIALVENQDIDFQGGKFVYTSEMKFLPCSSERVQCYQVLDMNGFLISPNMTNLVTNKDAVKVYSNMVILNTMDKFFYEAQRQGRLSFYLTSFGEEAISVASAAALSSDDIVLAQYREPGILLWRGYTVLDFANQCFGNNDGHGKGRQMPVHYGSKNLNFITLSSPLATQLPQAVGMAYSLKMDKKDSCVVAFFGDGSASEGDFHAALTFSAVMDTPIVFICRNNGWAISTPITEQARSDGIVVRGRAYGILSIRVDGNDALAIYNVVRHAREIAINEQRPILIEAMTYRVSHHSTSDDSTKYRSVDEIEHWRTTHSPITRLRKWVERKGWWSEKEESRLHYEATKQVKQAIGEAEKEVKPSLGDLFTDVYDEMPSNLIEQENVLRETVQKHPKDFPMDIPL